MNNAIAIPAAQPISLFHQVTVWTPDGPEEIPGERIKGIQITGVVSIVSTCDENGRQVDYVGMPFKAEHQLSQVVRPLLAG